MTCVAGIIALYRCLWGLDKEKRQLSKGVGFDSK